MPIDFNSMELIKARIEPHSFVIEIEKCVFLRFDTEGRWCSLQENNEFFRRTIDGHVISSLRPERVIQKREPGPVHQLVLQWALDLHKAIAKKSIPVKFAGKTASCETLLNLLEKVALWTPDHFAREIELYNSVYPEPVLILPPDRYRDVVIFPTLGCPFAQCSFCAFYQNSSFKILSPKEFEKHLVGIIQLFGKALSARNGAFLGSANALALSQKRLLTVVESILTLFPPLSRGIAAFWDPDHAPVRSVNDWNELANVGIKRVFVGLETGCPDLRQSLGKSSHITKLMEAISICKKSNISIGIIVLAGVGGSSMSTKHQTKTLEVLQAMQLSSHDIVYISPLQGTMAPTLLEQESLLLQNLIKKHTKAKVTSYQMNLFHYYA